MLVVGGALVVIAIGPRLIDLLAALATGTVGAFALVRSDISDTLPGVAIAISLVPPLAVVGLLLSVQRYSDATGALLLFGTNVAAIIATGAAVLIGYRVRDAARDADYPVGQLRGRTLAVVAALVIVVAIPLGYGTLSVGLDEQLASRAKPLADEWASSNRWVVTTLSAASGEVVITALGSPPDADVTTLRQSFNDNGLADAGLVVRLVLGGSATCPAGGVTCTLSTD